MKKFVLATFAISLFLSSAFGMESEKDTGIRFFINNVINKTNKKIVGKILLNTKIFEIKSHETKKINKKIIGPLSITITTTDPGRKHILVDLILLCSKDKDENAKCRLISNIPKKYISEDSYLSPDIGKNADILIDVTLEGNNLELSKIEFVKPTLNKDELTQFTQNISKEFTMNTTDPISLESFKDLVKSKHPFFLAVVKAGNTYNFFDASELAHVFRVTKKIENPTNRQPITEIFIYKYNGSSSSFPFDYNKTVSGNSLEQNY